MKLFYLLIIANLATANISVANSAQSQSQNVRPRWSVQKILGYVLDLKKISYNSEITLPEVIYLSEARLSDFQVDAQAQWGFKPDIMSNVYFFRSNKIYLDDDSDYYRRNKRFVEDSLAHELTHFYQVKYRNWDLNDESLEWDAIEVQSNFREFFKSQSEANR